MTRRMPLVNVWYTSHAPRSRRSRAPSTPFPPRCGAGLPPARPLPRREWPSRSAGPRAAARNHARAGMPAGHPGSSVRRQVTAVQGRFSRQRNCRRRSTGLTWGNRPKRHRARDCTMTRLTAPDLGGPHLGFCEPRAEMAAISSRTVSAGVSCRVLDPHSFSFELAAGLAGNRAGTLVVPVREHRLSPLAARRGDEGRTGELRTALLQCCTSWNRLRVSLVEPGRPSLAGA
jgi:hypothetical protein